MTKPLTKSFVVSKLISNKHKYHIFIASNSSNITSTYQFILNQDFSNQKTYTPRGPIIHVIILNFYFFFDRIDPN